MVMACRDGFHFMNTRSCYVDTLQAFGAPFIVADIDGKKETFFGSSSLEMVAHVIGKLSVFARLWMHALYEHYPLQARNGKGLYLHLKPSTEDLFISVENFSHQEKQVLLLPFYK